jgi:hypothetical protein
VEYHDGSTEQHETMTETALGSVQSGQGWVQQELREPNGM